MTTHLLASTNAFWVMTHELKRLFVDDATLHQIATLFGEGWQIRRNTQYPMRSRRLQKILAEHAIIADTHNNAANKGLHDCNFGVVCEGYGIENWALAARFKLAGIDPAALATARNTRAWVAMWAILQEMSEDDGREQWFEHLKLMATTTALGAVGEPDTLKFTTLNDMPLD